MPFKIIRNDITRVRADVIVNTANPEPRYASGTDAAIYIAAGANDLLEARKKIGRIAPGEAAVTAAFALPAKYIIHTVGPVWIDGNHGEYDILRFCYRKSLLLADQLGCESIAFPLIATGVYGFPKDQALEIALSVIKEHLEGSDLDVTLVVFGSASYQLASGFTEQVEAYNKLWKMLIGRKMSHIELQRAAEVAPNTMTKSCRDQPVHLEILDRMCRALVSMELELSPTKMNLFRILPASLVSTGLKITCRSGFGDRFMYQHSIKAPDEMKQLHDQFYQYLRENKGRVSNRSGST